MNIISAHEDSRGKYGAAPGRENENDVEGHNGEQDEQGSFGNEFNGGENGTSHFDEYTSRLTRPGSNPSLIKQGLIMLLSAFVGATLMILILGGRKTYNITQEVPSLSSSSNLQGEDSMPIMTSNPLPFTISYAAANGPRQLLPPDQARAICERMEASTSSFVDEKIKLYFLTTFQQQFQIASILLETNSTCVDAEPGTHEISFEMEVDFVADSGPISYVVPDAQLSEALHWSFFKYDNNNDPGANGFKAFLQHGMNDLPFSTTYAVSTVHVDTP